MSPPEPVFLGHDIYRHSSFGPHHPLRVPRVSTVMDLSRALGWLPAAQYRTSPRARPKALMAWHSADYVAALQAAEAAQSVTEPVRLRHGLGTVSNPVYPDMFRRPATSAGGAILAGQILAQPGRVYHPAGGTHHGFPDRAAGFCYLNDPVIAMLSLRASGVSRIAYVDIDAHHPDGVEHAFAHDPNVLMISVHEERRWPFTGALEDRGCGTVWNMPVPRGFNDTEMAAIRDRVILPRVAAFRPDAIVLQCGADAVLEDPLSRLALSNSALWACVAVLSALTDRYLVLGGGGYNPWSVGRAWTGVWATLNGNDIPDRLPFGAEAVLRALAWRNARAGKSPPDHWFETLADTPRPGPLRDEVDARIRILEGRAEAWV